MACFPIRRYRLFEDPFDRFFGDQLDFFDPWYDFDTLPSDLSARPNTFRWINEPQRLTNPTTNDENNLQPTTRATNSEKFRIQLNIAEFNPETIQTRIDGQQVIVEAKQEDRPNNDDYCIQQIRKTYDLPEYSDINHLTSYITPNNLLVIEVPVHNPENDYRLSQSTKENQNLSQFGQYRDPLFDYVAFLTGSDFQSRIIDKGDNQKQMEISIEMKCYQPEEIKVSVKNNELIVQGEHKYEDNKRLERSYFFKSTTLPPGTQIDQLKSQLTNDGYLKIEAPFIEQQSIEN
jgi:HSP20 family molecular chaperone IbpA